MEAGQTIAGKYRLNQLLGTGGMATVWSARNVFTERDFAIKFMHPEVTRTPDAARRFLREAKVSARINHPNIIEVIDVGQAEDGTLFLVMELLAGVSLETALRRQTPAMRVGQFVAFMRDVAEALGAAHRRGVIHRDLKPTNVFLHTDREDRIVPKVLDFGVSKILEDDSEGLTVVGTILGSPLYMSPEQAIGAEGIDGRTDVFAFGTILFEALCGQRPYSALNLNALIVAIATQQPRNIDELAPHLPESLRAVVRECLVTDKANRIASFEGIAERLSSVLVEIAGAEDRLPRLARSSSESVSSASGPSSRRRTSDRQVASASGASAATSGIRTDAGGTSPPLSIPNATPQFGAGRTPGPASFSPSPAGAGSHATTLRSTAIGLVGLALLAVVAGLARRGTWGSGSTAVAPRPMPAMAMAASRVATTPVVGSVASPADPPVIAVDALPLAAHASVYRTKNNARLTIAATPGACSITVDGVSRGVTPLAGFAVAPGNHQVECSAPGVKMKTATVAVTEGSEAHYQFSLIE